MNNFLLSAASLTLAICIGSIVFQSFVVAPTVFASLEKNEARIFLRTLFPRFFRVNGVAGFVAAVSLAGAGAGNGWTAFYLWATLGAVVIPAAMLVCLSLIGAINAARDQGESGAGRFARLHGVSVLLTVISLISATGILLAVGATSIGY